jgi:hypothetical protein
MPAAHYDTYFFPLIKRLSEDESFTSRASAPPLFAIANPKLPDAKKPLLKTYDNSSFISISILLVLTICAF